MFKINVNVKQCVFYTFIPPVNLEQPHKDNQTHTDIVVPLTL
jgi:hypothetical protein